MTVQKKLLDPQIPYPNNVSLYFHIPFCKKKCSYCDFVSYAGKEDLIDEYVDALIREFELLRSTFNFQLSTIYFGGGTPTLLKTSHFENIINTLICHLSLDICHSEISIEANPGTVSFEYLRELRILGINRISIGVQSFNDKHLKTLGRIHNSAEAIKAVEDARKAGFENISIDLIFAIPNQTLEEWKGDLQIALSLSPEHLSTYNLQIEEGTPLFERMTNNKIQRTNEDLDADMYEFTIDWLTANGFRHYEVSNFTKPGLECKHNINYWKMGSWIGIGTGAKSHIGKTNTSDAIFMGLRLIDGINKSLFKGFEKEVQDLCSQGLIEEFGQNIKLTRKGLLLGNLVFEKFV